MQTESIWIAGGCCLLLTNLTAFCLMGADKRRAIRGRWRIPERTLLLTCAFFGALGGLLGMRAFRHKTLHKRFSWGVPAMLVFQATLLACLLIHYA